MLFILILLVLGTKYGFGNYAICGMFYLKLNDALYY